MTPEMVRARVDSIRSVGRSDDELAHVMEDDLFAELLGAIASGGCSQPEKCCEEALKSQDIEFERWSA